MDESTAGSGASDHTDPHGCGHGVLHCAERHEVVMWTVAVLAVLATLRCVGWLTQHCCRAHSQVPHSPEPSAEWLTAALHASTTLRPSARIRSVTMHEVGGGLSGTQLVKLQLDIDEGSAAIGSEYRTMIEASIIEDPAVLASAGPRSAIHKYADYRNQIPRNVCSDGGCMTRIFMWSTGIRVDVALAQEAKFYRDVVPILQKEQADLSLPKIYHVGLEGSHSSYGCCFVCGFDWCWPCGCNAGNVDVRSSIIQEDLGSRGLTSIHVMSHETPPAPVVRTAFQMIARLHRFGWTGNATATEVRDAARETGLVAFMTGQHYYNTNTVTAYGEGPALETFINVWTKCNWNVVDRTAGVKRTAGEPTLEWLFLKDQRALKMLREMRACAGPAEGGKAPTGWAAESIKLERNLTLLHGDFHKGNIMYHKVPLGVDRGQPANKSEWSQRYGQPAETDIEVVLIDFQFFGTGNPAWELTYFLLLSAVDPTHDDMLLAEYHNHLVERGGAAAAYTLERLRNEVMLTMGTMLVQIISEAAHPGKAAELAEQFGSTDQRQREQAITGHRITARLVKRLLHYKNTPGWQSDSLLFKPLPVYTPPPTGYGSASHKQDQQTPLLDRSTELQQQPRGERGYRRGSNSEHK